jgi:hypothetical protein
LKYEIASFEITLKIRIFACHEQGFFLIWCTLTAREGVDGDGEGWQGDVGQAD